MSTIIIADDHPLTLNGTAQYVGSLGHSVKAICSNGTSALNAIFLHQPDIALIDINMPGLDGLDVLKTVVEKKLRTKVILLTMHNEFDIYLKAKEMGAWGYALKEEALQELKPCIESVINNQHWVSDKLVNKTNNYPTELASELSLVEAKIVELIRKQKSTKQIAELLFLSDKTIEKHRTRIIEKLGLPKEKNALLKWAMMLDTE